jgi:hypothetical protein
VKPEQFDPLYLVRSLVDGAVRFVLIGGFAAAVRGSAVVTDDVDICHARDDDNLERLAGVLRSLDARLRGAPADVPSRPAAATLRAGDHFTFATTVGRLDCFATPAGTDGFEGLDANATDRYLDGMTVRVASIDDLIRMKRATGRPQDLIVVGWLRALRDEDEPHE